MNRKQRRDQFKAARGNPDALWCPKCGHRTIHAAVKVPKDEDHYEIYCSVCQMWKSRLRLDDKAIGAQNRLNGRVLTDRQKLIVERKLI